jgi:hypothetical protein
VLHQTLLALILLGVSPGKEVGFHAWSDSRGLHLRWTSNGHPVLFTGSVLLDKPAGTLARINPLAGGWVDKKTENELVFSATATAGIDGADLDVPAGTTVKVDVQIDGMLPDLNLIYSGEKEEHPKELPMKLKVK